MLDVQATFDWLVDGAPGAKTPLDVIARVCPDLVAAGVPLDRCEAFVRTLHPHIVGRNFVWTPGRPVSVRENSYAFLQSPEFAQSPVGRVFATGGDVRCRLADPAALAEFPQLAGLAGEGYVDYYASPMKFMSGQVHAITFATRAAQGFTPENLAAVRHLVRPLSRVGETFALMRTAANLLNTYVGHDAGERILAGRIQRGDTDTMRAVMWFSDLRGFTTMSARLPPGEIIRTLNDVFDCQVPAIEKHGGEVLKFMGDGLLAIFPLEGGSRTAADVCDAALEAADEAYGALDRLNEARAAREPGAPPIRFGLALHVGDVAYGNIGGSGRLDFTCIGPAVNLAARLEGLTGRLEERMVLSAEFARLTGRPSRPVGTFELKGVPGAVEVFAPQ